MVNNHHGIRLISGHFFWIVVRLKVLIIHLKVKLLNLLKINEQRFEILNSR